MKKRLFSLLPLVVLLGACVTIPTASENLDEAQQAVARAEDNPDVSRHASVALRDAQQNLRKAQQLAEQAADPETVDHYAYLAKKQALIAETQTQREMAVRSTEDLEQQRTQALLEDRERSAEQARGEAERLREEAERSRQALEEAQNQLADLQPRQTDRGIVLTMGEVLFAFDSAELQAGNQRSLDRLAEFLQAHPDQNILIEGHTDSVGDAGYNERLSEQRADSVSQALTQRGIDPSRVRVEGLGENFPVADNDTQAGRAENRRVEVVIAEQDMPQSRQEQQARQGSADTGDAGSPRG